MNILNSNQMEKINGGWLLQFVVAYIIIDAVANLPSTIDAIKRGWNDATH